MMKGHRLTPYFLRFSLLGLVGSLSGSAFAAGFQLYEENASALGNAYAGVGASAEDASIEFYNPAGMTLLTEPELTASAVAIDLNVTSTVTSATNTVTIDGAPPVTEQVSGNMVSHPGGWNTIPALHFVYPYGDFAFGLGATAPFGLEIQYSDQDTSRFIATQSKVKVINAGPSVAYQITHELSAGVGFDVQYLDTTLDTDVVNGLDPSGTTGQGYFTNTGTNTAYGWNAGLLYQFTPQTRAGVSYRSRVDHNINGDASLMVPSINPLQPPINLSGGASTDFIIPANADFSIFHEINKAFDVKASIDYTQWHDIQNLTITYSGDIATAVQSSTTPLNFQDTLRYSVGVDFHVTPAWTTRTGVAFDQSPVPNQESRTFRLPDTDRVWLGFGTQYHINKYVTVDAGYAHLFVPDTSATNTRTTNTTASFAGETIPVTVENNASAIYNSSVDEFGLQLTWRMV